MSDPLPKLHPTRTQSQNISMREPKVPSINKRIGLYKSAVPRDAVNSLTAHTANQSVWPSNHYAPPVVHRYRPTGSREIFLCEHALETENKRHEFMSDVQRYWKSKLGQPEYRGKCKNSLCANNDRYLLYPSLKKVHCHPLIPRAAEMAERTNKMPPVKRTVFSGQWREVETARNAIKCDSLLDQLLSERK